MRRTGILEIDVRPGMTAAVVGSGTLGLLAVALQSDQPGTAGTRRHAPRLALGEAMGRDRNVRQDEYPEPGFDLVFEAAGTPEGARTAVELARRGGTVVLEAISGNPAGSTRTRSCSGTCACRIFGASRNAWRWVTELFADGLLDTKPLVTHLPARPARRRLHDARRARRRRAQVQLTPR